MDFMVDIETLGTKPGAVVLTVGAVAFNRESGDEVASFYRPISLRSSRDARLSMDANTVLWWFKQGQAAQKAAFLSPDAHPLQKVAADFSTWFMKHRTRENAVWAQGMDFDFPIWSRAMAAVGERPPWEFWSVRDTRTIYDIANFDPKSVPREAVHHNALDDARHQVRCLRAALDRLAADDFLNT